MPKVLHLLFWIESMLASCLLSFCDKTLLSVWISLIFTAHWTWLSCLSISWLFVLPPCIFVHSPSWPISCYLDATEQLTVCQTVDSLVQLANNFLALPSDFTQSFLAFSGTYQCQDLSILYSSGSVSPSWPCYLQRHWYDSSHVCGSIRYSRDASTSPTKSASFMLLNARLQ